MCELKLLANNNLNLRAHFHSVSRIFVFFFGILFSACGISALVIGGFTSLIHRFLHISSKSGRDFE